MYFESTMVQSRYKIIGYMRSTIPALYTHVMLYISRSRLLEPIIRCFFRCHSHHLYPPRQPIFALPTFYHPFY
ncbi:hypothetical protein J007_06639 [Cryptococcus neoformans]|nr:hypothetical protein J007_06639 [Cryptococcus neoformans var. grubii]OXC57830.1 hypothetical protein C358_06733 [Cryptococcus neoformans var. grubii MW-RSA852]